MKEVLNYSLRDYNTFGIESRCQRFLEYATLEEACDVARSIQSEDEKALIVGQGSNLLLTGDFRGTVIHSAIKGYEVVEAHSDIDSRQKTSDEIRCVRVGSGEVWDDFVSWCVENGWYGAENLSLIPGEVGAAAVQNIGAYGSEVCNIISSVEAVELHTGRQCRFSASDCQYGYRMSKFKKEWKNRYLITYVTFLLRVGNVILNTSYGNIRQELDKRGIVEPSLAQLRNVIIDIRQQKLPDPKTLGNAGSFFMNPVVDISLFERLLAEYPQMPHYHVDDFYEKIPAGWLIERCGWKGRSLGPAAVHDKQALVLVNLGGATGRDIVSLSDAIRHDVSEKFGIDIHPEVNIV